MKKTVILFLLSALLLFSGCTDNKTAPEDETPIPAAEESAPAPILLPDGSEAEADTVSLCPHGNVGEDLLAWQEALSQLPALRELDLTGSTLSAEELRSLQESCAARLYCAPTVCGRKLELDLTSCAPRGGKWRGEYINGKCIFVDRYVLLKEQFGYHYPDDYAMKEADPLYRYHG